MIKACPPRGILSLVPDPNNKHYIVPREKTRRCIAQGSRGRTRPPLPPVAYQRLHRHPLRSRPHLPPPSRLPWRARRESGYQRAIFESLCDVWTASRWRPVDVLPVLLCVYVPYVCDVSSYPLCLLNRDKRSGKKTKILSCTPFTIIPTASHFFYLPKFLTSENTHTQTKQYKNTDVFCVL